MTFEFFSSRETDPDWQSKAIMKNLDCDYSHVGIIKNGVDIYHSTGEGVNKKDLDDFLKDHVFIHRVDITEYVINHDYAEGWLDGNIGKDYSESQYLGFINKKWRRICSDGKSEMICSEFNARFTDETTSIPIFDTVNCDFVKPTEYIKGMFLYINEHRRQTNRLAYSF